MSAITVSCIVLTPRATFTVGQLRTLIDQIKQLGTVNIVYFEGREPFLFYPLMLEGLRMVRAAGLDAGIADVRGCIGAWT